MVKVRKFAGYIANKDLVDKIISPPYDVCTVEEAKEETGDNEYYYFHVNKPAIDLPDGATLDEIAEKGRANLQHFIDSGYLVRDDAERIYIYSQQMGDHIQYGVMWLSSVDDYANNKIKKHEHTLPDVEKERTILCDVQNGNAEPVFFSFRGGDDIKIRINEIVQAEPYAKLETDDHVIHTLWKWSEEDSNFIVSEFEKIDSTYIADGHHRSAAAFNTGVLRRQRAIDAGIEVTGDETFNFFLTVIFPDTQCKILDYNRLLNTLNDMDEDEFIDRLSESYVITDKDEANPRPVGPGHVSMYIKDKWFDLAIKPEKLTGDPSKDIDYQLLTDYCFKEIMGIENIKKDGRVEFVGGGRGINYLVTRCHKDCKAAFLMPPATMEQIFAVADAGQTMPPKCTWFEPKLRSGFVVNFFDDPTAKK